MERKFLKAHTTGSLSIYSAKIYSNSSANTSVQISGASMLATQDSIRIYNALNLS